MPIAELYSGTEAVGATEWSCTTDTSGPDADTTDGVFQFFVDVNDLALGDVLQIRLYEKAQAAGTQYLVEEWIIRDVPTSKIFVSPSFILMHGWDFTLKALAGTITCNWSIRQVS